MANPTNHIGTSPSPMEITGHGSATVGTSEAALPDVAGRLVLLKSLSTNADIIYFGDGSVTTASGMELTAGEWSPLLPLPAAGLSGLNAIAGAASQDLRYIVFK